MGGLALAFAVAFGAGLASRTTNRSADSPNAGRRSGADPDNEDRDRANRRYSRAPDRAPDARGEPDRRSTDGDDCEPAEDHRKHRSGGGDECPALQQ